jgi:cytoskeletal protein RodZ
MDFKLVSKNNLGVVTALLLVILLSQGRVFNFLLDTALGRAILILFILVISYTNKILGVVSVLFIIIMFNNSDIGYLEGFTDSSSTNNSNSSSTTTTSSKMPTNSNKDTTSTSTDTTSTSTDTTTTPTLTDEQKQQLMATLQEKAKDKDTSTVTSSSTAVSGGVEGFNTFESERNIQKGKQSNSIPVSSYSSQSDNVEAFGSFGGKFSDSFASF